MSYTVVQSWATDATLTNGLPVPCLIEDDDAIRMLAISGETVPEETYRIAVDAGAQAVISFGTPNHFLLIEQFAELRAERAADYVFEVPAEYWRTIELAEPTYVELELFEVTPRELAFVNLHTHTEFSSYDALPTLEECAQRIVADGQPAMAVSDHGVCAGHPPLQKIADKYGFKPIFAMEAYFCGDRFSREDASDYTHLVLIAMDDAGLRNLWAMSTESWRDGFHGHPRLDWDTLERLNEGVIATTACLRGPVLRPLQGVKNKDGSWKHEPDPELAISNLARLLAIFGDRLYIELQTHHLPAQIEGNKWLVRVALENGLPFVAVSDSHYACPEDQHTHAAWLGITAEPDEDEGGMFADRPELHMRTAAQALADMAYLGDDVARRSIDETVRLAERCTASIVPNPTVPIFSRATEEWPDRIAHDEQRLYDLCMSNWERLTKGKSYSQEDAWARFNHEFPMLKRKKVCGYYLMTCDQTNYAHEQKWMVGPGRGSAAGSFVAYLAGITGIDPIENDLLFARFMTEGRTELPDFDIDYPASKKLPMLQHCQERWGREHVVLVGTHSRLQNKGAVKNTARSIKNELPEDYYVDLDRISKIIKDAEAGSAGLGISWDELLDVHAEELGPYLRKYPRLFELAGKLHGRLATYGRHAAGVVIDPDHSIEDALPLRLGEELEDGTPGAMVTQFDMEALAWLGYVKFDQLTLRTLDTLQMAKDLVERDFGREIRFERFREEYLDAEVFETLCAGFTKGIFQVETHLGTRMCKDLQPRNMADWADIIALGRPGPMNSGLTKEFIKRRSGIKEVSFDDPRLEQVLARTYGLMIYQEDIMANCMVLANYDDIEADEVRSILGKKKVEKIGPAGVKFISRAVENDTDREVAENLWEQKKEFAKYSFNRAHAASYAHLGFWTGWMMIHFPVQMMCALLSTVKDDRIPEFVEEARRRQIKVLPPDINLSGIGFRCTEAEVRYGFDSLKHVGLVAAKSIVARQPYVSFADFDERRHTKEVGAGVIRRLVRIGAFDSLEPNRRALEALIEAQAAKSSSRCVHLTPDDLTTWDHPDGPVSLPCGYDWAAEPRRYGKPHPKTGNRKPLKIDPVPKKCTTRCRQFTPAPMPSPETIEPYTEADIADIELEMLGLRLSSSEFDRLPAELLEQLATAEDLATGPEGDYDVAAEIKSFRPHRTKNGTPMGFLTFATPMGSCDAVVFSEKMNEFSEVFTHRGLVFAQLRKTDRGLQLVHLVPA